MRLNLHIIRNDLADLDLNGRVRGSSYDRRLLYACFCDTLPASPSPEVLYLIRAEDLPSTPPRCARLSLICLGEPPNPWKTCAHSVIWTVSDAQPVEVLNDLSYLFWRYNHWESELRKIIEAQLPLSYSAEVTQPLFSNPFAALSVSYRMLFTSFPEVDDPSEDYLRYCSSVAYEGPFMPDEDIVSVVSSSQFEELQRSNEPVLLTSAGYSYQTLVYTLRVDGEACSYLCMDQVLSPITVRDRIVFKHFGDFLGKMLGGSDIYALTHPEIVQSVLRGLLEHRLLPEEQIEQLLTYFSWGMHDSFVTLVAAIRVDTKRQGALDPLALALARETSNECYLVLDDVICHVFDLTHMGVTRAELVARLEPIMNQLWLDASVSSCFDDFKNLYYYYRQARVAGRIGWHKDPQRDVHLFEDNAVDYLLDRLIRRHSASLAEVCVPDELKRLIIHDKERGCDYARLLDVYLRNDRNIAKTIRQEYIHRNTFNYRLRRIEEISGLDLDDEDMRFRLLVAFRLLEREGQSR